MNRFDFYERKTFLGFSSSKFELPEVWEMYPKSPDKSKNYYIWQLTIYYLDKDREKIIIKTKIIDDQYANKKPVCSDFYNYGNGIIVGLIMATLFFVLIFMLLFIFNII